ncbi:cysteine--tRNA ligase, partial [Myxococcota bacterium]|nr:cysteine--tRNA ligase [Myxococcota bacterium]
SSYSGVSAARKGFEKALDDDLNTSAALAAVFGLRQDLIKGKLPNCAALDACTFLDEVDAILGLFDEECSQDALSDDAVESLLKERKEAREAQNWSLSDEIRDQLLAEGITIEDDSSGTSWHRSG